ncbi:MAG: 5-(carboxyamino)imidazole ribonucleotide synthase [Saprospiraceae bacterium]|nr:5-(carboxyamino)imidazole ribonucleotide synthase [Saprospiraceae bacterium]
MQFPKIGILGGGQLGKMLVLDGARMDLPLYILDQSATFPAGRITRLFMEGDFTDYDDVMAFGKDMDVLTIEIEKVNIDALFDLRTQGVTVHPNPDALAIIRDKGLQKQYFLDHAIPTTPFQLVEDLESWRLAIGTGQTNFPIVQKLRSGGYDGRGVAVLKSAEDLETKGLPGPSVMEELVDIDKEIAVIAARNTRGEIVTYDPVEMVFDPEANLVDYLSCPAKILPAIGRQASAIAKQLIESLEICGLLAVEFFVNRHGQLLVNEIAPRPHNSGHHTIESCATSQFQQHLRGILNWPLGDVTNHHPAVMVNLLGAPGYQGPVRYQGLEDVLAEPQVYVHLYGKEETKPYRKMGHMTALGKSVDEALSKARKIQQLIQVIS